MTTETRKTIVRPRNRQWTGNICHPAMRALYRWQELTLELSSPDCRHPNGTILADIQDAQQALVDALNEARSFVLRLARPVSSECVELQAGHHIVTQRRPAAFDQCDPAQIRLRLNVRPKSGLVKAEIQVGPADLDSVFEPC